ncbi:hypothetical protein KR51_00007610 [Rubidibacter lacunae KORDI 51-2]|uniref:Uncharacterized protein n=1 Tax=Rubidibacter lacunae KORDI 51-2 TaxID=582515 RepID=U5DPC0_9CHRO|nr:hypothetical protein KR51_00007610 [Rubidibacter lacunae KORDI 51-2]
MTNPDTPPEATKGGLQGATFPDLYAKHCYRDNVTPTFGPTGLAAGAISGSA